MKTFGSFLDGSFGEARGLEEAAGRGRVASGVEGGRRFGLVGSDGGVWVEGCGGGAFYFKADRKSTPLNSRPPNHILFPLLLVKKKKKIPHMYISHTSVFTT